MAKQWPFAAATGLTALLLLTSCKPSANETGDGLIAFASRRGGWFSIYTVRPDGTDIKKLIDIVKAEDVHTGNYLDVIGQPAWSSDGSRIAFVCPLEGRSGLCVTDSDGSDAVHLRLGSAEQDRLPAWSRDGQIAFARQFDNKDAAIYLTDPDEPEVRQLTEGYFDFNPTWAPDGEQIAFIRRINDEYDIYLMNEDGSSSRPLKRTAGAEGNVVWAPDGERLAYIIGEPEQDVYVTDLETLNRRNITQSSDPEGWPTWSPDGRRLAFMCGPGTGICVINADGTGRRQIVDGATLNMQPAWQPT